VPLPALVPHVLISRQIGYAGLNYTQNPWKRRKHSFRELRCFGNAAAGLGQALRLRAPVFYAQHVVDEILVLR
jgi:hypothetical protein